METVLDLVPIALIPFAILIFLVLVRASWTLLKGGLNGILPRPFLGEGTNAEWAEKKRAELEAARLNPGPWDNEPHSAPLEEGDTDLRAAGSGHNGTDEWTCNVDAELGEVSNGMLPAWLIGTGNREDAWAEKVLGRPERSKET